MILSDTTRLLPGSRYTVAVSGVAFGERSALEGAVVSVFSGTLFPVDAVSSGLGQDLQFSGVYQGLTRTSGELSVAEFKRFAQDRINRISGIFFESVNTVSSGGLPTTLLSPKSIVVIVALLLGLLALAWLTANIARLAGK